MVLGQPQWSLTFLDLGGRGIRQSVRKGIRQADKSFFGVRCPHLGVDCLTRQVSLVLIHYGSNTAVGKMLRILMEIMIIELGMGTQPFWEDYSKYRQLVTDLWLKSLWEKVD